MKIIFSISPVKRLIIAGLVIAFIGVVIQILSNVHYPKVPPVFFILLIPVGLLIFSKWRWLPILIILATLFLILGLFSSGASARLVNFTSIGGSIGLWVQMIGVVFAMITAIASLVQNYGTKKLISKRPSNWLLSIRNVLICVLVLIALIVASRRLMSLTGIIKTYINPKFGEFDSGFKLHPFLTFLHIVPGILFIVLAPLQFINSIRVKYIRMHRILGWFVATAASIIGVTALVMSFKLSIGGATETSATVVFAVFFLFALFKAIYHIRKHEMPLHREWMIRMFSIGLAIASVRPIVGLFFVFSNLSPHQFFGIAFWLGFSIHLIVAECWIRFYNYK